jgi:diguanylate cyclase (GGDEF)-like protein
MNTLTKLNENFGPIHSITDYRTLNFDDFKEYEYYRLVDPTTKEVFSIKNNKLVPFKNEHCYDMWDTGEPCKYCVSANALETRSEKKKLEYLKGELNIARVIPILFDNRELVLELFQNLSSTYFKNENQYDQISDMVKQLNKLASLETFTNLYSHSFTKNKLTTFMEGKLKMELKTVTLVQMDINNLKHVNDTYGHITGDELILKVAAILSPLKDMENIYPGRTGGDEFQIILLNITEKEAKDILSTYFKQLNNIQLDTVDYIASVSYGYLEWNKIDAVNDFINKVDKLMYYNKRLSKGLI